MLRRWQEKLVSDGTRFLFFLSLLPFPNKDSSNQMRTLISTIIIIKKHGMGPSLLKALSKSGLPDANPEEWRLPIHGLLCLQGAILL